MPTANSPSWFDTLLLKKIRAFTDRSSIRVRFDRDGLPAPDEAGVETVAIRDPHALVRIALDPEVGFGDAYMEGQIEINGNLVSFLEEAFRLIRSRRKRNWYHRIFSRWLQLMQSNTREGSARNIRHHYDLDTDFYKLWLDDKLVYTCAYFPTASATLEEAQEAKLHHVCRKLQLQPGERVVEAGCGWGALALHMARHYGVTVRAFNISREQVQFARSRATREGLTGQVEFVEDDYRNISGRFDKFISVGMLEHVGREHYRELADVIHRAIGDSGRGLIHFIGRNRSEAFSAWIRKHIFPGAYAPTLRESLEMFELHNYAVLDVENLRFHYAKTLEHWLERYECAVDRVSAIFGTEFARAWRLYLAGSIAGFRIGTLQLFQIVFAGSACREIPWTRAYLYAGETGSEREPQWTHATF
jgi:cyclopropane-fatty-acyl-phospholipid synthase